jgi:hypothetical protein
MCLPPTVSTTTVKGIETKPVSSPAFASASVVSSTGHF